MEARAKNKKMQDINLKITDRNGAIHEVLAPTDMSMNLMRLDVIKEIISLERL